MNTPQNPIASTLRERFAGISLRERAGQTVDERFNYQKTWAFCHLLTLHSSGQDYLLAFELHDDVLEFDSSTDPKSLRFFQVKTKEAPGKWRLSDLLRRKAGKDEKPLLSIVGKMYHNKLTFPDEAHALVFVSNAPIGLSARQPEGGNTDGRTHICCSDLTDNAIKKITTQLQQEHGLNEPPAIDTLMFFRVASDLPLESYDVQGKGRLSNFLESLHPNRKFRIGAAYKAILSEINSKNKYPGPLNSFEDVLQHKAIGRRDFERMLEDLGATGEDLDDRWSRAQQQLTSEGTSAIVIKRLHTQWRSHEVQRSRPAVRELLVGIRTALAPVTVDETFVNLSLLQTVDKVVQNLRQEWPSCDIHDHDYLRAAVMMEFYA